MSKNPTLRKLIKLYVTAAINLVGNDSGTKFPSADWSEAPEFPFFFSHEKLKELPEYKKCLKELEADPVITSQLDVLIGIHSRRSRSSNAEELMMRLPHLAVYKNTIKFNKECFDREYIAFESALYDKNFIYEVIVPLSGPAFNEPIKVSDKVEICQVNRSDLSLPLKTEVEVKDRPYFDEPVWAVHTRYCLLKVVGDETRISPEGSESDEEIRNEANETIEQVLTCLRLLGASNVYAHTVIHRTKSWFFHDVRQYPIKYFPATQFSLELQKDFHKIFVKFWRNFQKQSVNKHKFIALAARRFSYAHERHDWEDRIIDLLIAAEAIFLSQSNAQTELNYRLKLHAAMFLGSSAEIKKQIFDDMAFAYSLRSNIVHGSTGLEKIIRKIKSREEIGFGEKYKLDQFMYRIQEYIRIAICKMIDLAAQNSHQKEVVDWNKLVLEK